MSTSVTTVSHSTTTTETANPAFPVQPRSWLLLHIKIVPRYNDEELVQHADDQINDGSDISGLVAAFKAQIEDAYGASYYDHLLGGPHEVAGFPIGGAIEAYQGWKTCEIFYELLDLDTDGDVVLDGDGNPLIQGARQTYEEEGLCETKKIIFIPEITESSFYHFIFRMRTEWASSNYIDVDQYVYAVMHDSCGNLGGEPSRASPAQAGGGGEVDRPYGDTTTTVATTTVITTTSRTTSLSTSASRNA